MTIQQIIRRVAVIIALCGWFSWTIASADTGTAQELSDSEIMSFGCLVGGAGLLTAGYWGGPSEAIMLWGGGLLVPSGSSVLAISMLGALGAAGCSIGATLAPTVIWVSEQVNNLFSYAVTQVK